MLEAQINQAQDMILRLHGHDRLRKSGLSIETIMNEHPEVLVSYAEINGWNGAVREILILSFGSGSDYVKQWNEIPGGVPDNIPGESEEQRVIKQLGYSISFLYKIETIIKIKISS